MNSSRIFMCVLFGVIISFIDFNNINGGIIYQNANRTYIERYTQSNFDSVRICLVNEVNDYINKASKNKSTLDGSIVVDKCLEYDIDLCFVLAQGEIESHFGTEGLARKTNSVFNVLAFDGHSYSEISHNGKYNHPNNSVEPYLSLLRNCYLVDGKTEYDMLNEFVNNQGKRYASSKTYEINLKNKRNKIINNTDIDNKYRVLKNEYCLINS